MGLMGFRKYPRRANGSRRRSAKEGPTYAAIDLGTNNCRLLIARPTVFGFEVVDAFSRIVRLGEGVATNGCFSSEAMSRTIAALKICVKKIRRSGASRIRSVATEACRRSSNAQAFQELVESEAGLDLEIISEAEEARLAVQGCAPLLSPDAVWALVFDIGGGSTELIWLRYERGSTPDILAWTSLPCGVVSLAEHHGGDRVTRADYEVMVRRVRDLLSPFDAETNMAAAIDSGKVQMLGSSGTVTTVAGIHLGLPHYIRSRVDGQRLDFREVDAVSARLMDMDYETRAAMPCIGPDRADLVVAGCAILDAIQRTWPIGGLTVADRGLREGLLFGMMRQDRQSSATINV